MDDESQKVLMTKLHDVRNDIKDDVAGVYAHLKQDLTEIRRDLSSMQESGGGGGADPVARIGLAVVVLLLAVLLLLEVFG